MKYTQILLTINFVLLAALAGYVISQGHSQKQGYVLNQEVFEGFHGKQYLEKQLEALRQAHQAQMDSLVAVVKAHDTEAMRASYDAARQRLAMEEQQLSDQYSADIWKEINTGIAAYGKDHGYDFILGASGDGSLMYANEAENVTKEVVAYLNERYGAN